MKKRTPLELTTEELQRILKGEPLPPDVGWEGLEPDSPEFARLFRLRNNPQKLARTLLKERGGTYTPSIPLQLRQEKLELQRLQLELQKKKLEKQGTMMKQLASIQEDVRKLLQLFLKLLQYLEKREHDSEN